MKVSLVIDGKELVLRSEKGSPILGYEQFGVPEPYASMGIGEAPVIGTIYIKSGWRPPQKVPRAKT